MTRLTIIITLTLFSLVTFGQKSLKNFRGTIILKETHFFVNLSRTLTDTLITYYTFDIDSTIEIEEIAVFKGKDRSFKYIKFLFAKRNDSLFICFKNPTTNQKEFNPIYPINKRDTFEDGGCGYKLQVDSEQHENKYYKKIRYCNDEPNYDCVYKGDTILKVKGYIFDCYLVEQTYEYRRNMYSVRKRVFIDKKSLIPVYEDEYDYYGRPHRKFQVLNKWIRTREMKIIDIDD